jgi:hypothetical protein
MVNNELKMESTSVSLNNSAKVIQTLNLILGRVFICATYILHFAFGYARVCKWPMTCFVTLVHARHP